MSNPHWLTVREVAEELRLCQATVYNLVKSGELPALRVGNSVRIARSALDALTAAGQPLRSDTQVVTLEEAMRR